MHPPDSKWKQKNRFWQETRKEQKSGWASRPCRHSSRRKVSKHIHPYTHLESNNTKQREEPKIKKTNKTHREYVRGGLKTPSCIKRLLYTLRVDLRHLLHCLFAEEDSQRTLRGLSRYTCVVRTARRCAWPPRQHHGARTHRARPPAPSPQTSIMPLSAGWAFTIPLH